MTITKTGIAIGAKTVTVWRLVPRQSARQVTFFVNEESCNPAGQQPEYQDRQIYRKQGNVSDHFLPFRHKVGFLGADMLIKIFSKIAPGITPVSIWCDEYVKLLDLRDLHKKTLDKRKGNVSHIRTAIGHVKIGSVRPIHVAQADHDKLSALASEASALRSQLASLTETQAG